MAENTNINITAEAWADIVIDNWLDRIAKLQIGYYFQLEDTLKYELTKSASSPSVKFEFNYYGKFVDMGVGRGVKLEDVKTNSGFYSAGEGGSSRKPKKWYSRTLYSEVMKLSGILAQKYGRMGLLSIVEELDDNSMYNNSIDV